MPQDPQDLRCGDLPAPGHWAASRSAQYPPNYQLFGCMSCQERFSSSALCGVSLTMAHTRHALYVLYVIVAFRRLPIAAGARIKRPNHFIAIASTVKTDKVTTHHYEALYDKYPQPIAGDKLRLLEGKEQKFAVGSELKRTSGDLSLWMQRSRTWLWHGLWPGQLSEGAGMRCGFPRSCALCILDLPSADTELQDLAIVPH